MISTKPRKLGEQSQDSFDLTGRAPHELCVQRILAPTDFSESSGKAVEYAVSLARQFSATLILLHVVEPAIGVRGANFGSPAAEESSRLMLENGREALAGVCRRHVIQGVKIEKLVRMGRAYSEIADTAKALACDLIVMATRGAARETPTTGSTADWVVHHASCPVITTR